MTQTVLTLGNEKKKNQKLEKKKGLYKSCNHNQIRANELVYRKEMCFRSVQGILFIAKHYHQEDKLYMSKGRLKFHNNVFVYIVRSPPKKAISADKFILRC